jgi:hypothetical protein
VLLTLTLAFTAASHVAAFLLALVLSIGFMAYLAVGRRAYIVPIMMTAAIGTLLLLFACYDFSLDAFSYFFRSGAGRIWFSLQPARHWFLSDSLTRQSSASRLRCFDCPTGWEESAQKGRPGNRTTQRGYGRLNPYYAFGRTRMRISVQDDPGDANNRRWRPPVNP